MKTKYFIAISILGLFLLIAHRSHACYTPPCDDPGVFSLSAPPDNSSFTSTEGIVLEWYQSYNADRYHIYLAEDGYSLQHQGYTSSLYWPVDPSLLGYGKTYNWRILAENMGSDCDPSCTFSDETWSFTIDSSSVEAPTVVNSAATNVTTNSARLNGEVTDTGGENPTVIIYWGDNDGGTTPGNWDYSENIGTQSGSFYEDIPGLNASTTYYFCCYASNSGGTDWADSTEQFQTPEGTPPTPDPMTWDTGPYAVGTTSISMTVTTATDVSGVEYYFDCTAGAGGHDSGWQDSTTYEDTGLESAMQYTYKAQARDKSPAQNATGWSTSKSATTYSIVPDVVGQTESNASSAITDAGLIVGTVLPQCSDTVAAGLVISQSPTGGTGVPIGSTIDIVVSSGPDTDPPAAPTNLEATAADGLVELDWADNGEEDLTGYNIYRSTSGGPYQLIAEGWSPSAYTDSGLVKGTTYCYMVKAIDTCANESEQSNESCAVPCDVAPPLAPTGLTATPGNGTVSLNWTDNIEPDLAGYSLYRSTSGGPYQLIAEGLSSSTYPDSGLSNGTTYYYVVKAVDTSGNISGPSSEVSATPQDTTPPDPPVWVECSASDGVVSLDWADNTEPDLYGYNLYRSTTPGSSYSLIAFSLSESQYADTSVTNGTTYYYVVKAIDASGNISDLSSEVSATPQDTTPPDPPVWVECSASDGVVSLDWVDNTEPDLDGYNLYRSTTPGGSYDLIAPGLSESQYTDTSVTNGTTYYYVVTAVDISSNESTLSDEIEATPSDTVPPSAPTGLTAVASTAGIINLNWDDNDPTTDPDLAGYNVYRGTTSGFIPSPLSRIATVLTASEYPDDGVVNGPTYYYVVTAVDTSSNESCPSNETSARLEDWVYNRTKGTWHCSIQKAIDGSTDGDVIEASENTYYENVSFNGRNISVTSTDPDDPAVVAATIIDGSNTGNVVEFTSGDNSEFEGFTVKNSGSANSGIYCSSSNPVIANCVIEGNHHGISCNLASPGIKNNIIRNNASAGIDAGTGAPVIKNNLIHSNSGSGVAVGGPAIIRNCTIADNTPQGFDCYGSAAPIVSNCIVWGNTNDSTWTAGADVTYSCLQVDPGGQGNITDNPGLDGSYHLSAGSPCINGGDPDYVIEEDELDLDGERRVMAERIDMGAYEYGEVIFVNDNAPGPTHDGSTWEYAYLYLQDALADAGAGDEIWVAGGTYVPTTDPASKSSSFVLKTNVAIYGGFDGELDDSIDDRNRVQNETILSGDIEGDDVADGLPEGDNCYHVVEGADWAILDGFVVVGGSADAAAAAGGAGVYCDNVSMAIRNCTIERNIAKDGQLGGGVHSTNSSLSLINCLVHGNMATGNNAGGIYHGNVGTLEVINSTIVANAGDGVHIDNASSNLNNSILWYNRTVTNDLTNYPRREIVLQNGGTASIAYSNIEDGQGGVVGGVPDWGSGNKTDEPEFKWWGYWDLRLVNGTDLEIDVTELSVNPDEVTIYDFASQHADFGSGQSVNHDEDYFVADNLVDKKPSWDGSGGETSTLSGVDAFNLWWNEAVNDNKGLGHYNLEVPWVCKNSDKGIFQFNDEHFFPFNSGSLGPGDQSMAVCTVETCDQHDDQDNPHNWYFTLQYHTSCMYIPGMTLYFKASDDLFVAINDRIVIERGGYYVEQPSETELTFNADGTVTVHYIWSDPAKEDETYSFGLDAHSTYDFDLFYAQRHKPSTGQYPILVVQRTGSDDEMSPFYIPGDYHLQTGSLCIDAGDNYAVPAGVTTDLDGGLRFFDDPDTEPDTGRGTKPIVDMGVYEYPVNKPPVANDDSAATNAEEAVIIDVLANDSDPDFGALLAVAGVTQPSNGSVINNGSDVTYTPNAGFVGEDTFTYTAEDNDGAISNEAAVIVTVSNVLEVDAGEYEPITLPINFVNLDGEIIGDPGGLVHTTTWSRVYVPPGCRVEIDYPGQLDTKATFSGAGPYALKLVAKDISGSVLGSDETIILVKKGPVPGSQNPPEVDAGEYDQITLPAVLDLDGTITDDGLPVGIVISEWSLVPECSTGGTVSFGNYRLEDTTAEFSMDGTYRLRLWAFDGELEAADYVDITVLQNQPPTVEAGSDYVEDLTTIGNGKVLNLADLSPLQPSVEDDGLPDPPHQVTITWSKVHGPAGGMFFNNTKVEHPTATFTEFGVYVLQLEASDGQFPATPDTVEITINGPPSIDAGANKTATLTASSVNVYLGDASVEDRAWPYGDRVIAWSVPEKPSQSTPEPSFDDSTAQNPTVTFYEVGPYKLQLMVTDKGYTVVDTVWVTVEPEPQPEKKVLYAITDHSDSCLVEYEIEDNYITLQRTYKLETQDRSVGIAIDPETQYLFVTSEDSGEIQLIHAETMTEINSVLVKAGAEANLNGIVFDADKQKVYTVDRGQDELYILDWDAESKSLTLESVKILKEPNGDELGKDYEDYYGDTGAAGLALDEVDDILYVTLLLAVNPGGGATSISHLVYCYDTDDWSCLGRIEITVNGDTYNVVGVAVYNDGQTTKYLYTGGYSGHNLLIRTDLSNPDYPSIGRTVLDASCATGIAVDQDTGLVYVTQADYGSQQWDDCVAVYDTSDWESTVPIDNAIPTDCETEYVSGPAGLAVGGYYLYKPSDELILEVTPVGLDGCVYPFDEASGNYLTYQIGYEVPANPSYSTSNVVIVDMLAPEVDFDSASGNGVYDPGSRTVSWYLGDLGGGYSSDVTLRVKVNEHAKPAESDGIINICKIESDGSRTYDINKTSVCSWTVSDRIYVDENATGWDNGTSWPNAYRNLRDAVRQAQCDHSQDDPQIKEIWVAAGTYRPGKSLYDIDATFQMVEGVDIYGGFAGYETGMDQRDLTNPNNETILTGSCWISDSMGFKYAVTGADDACLDGFTIQYAQKTDEENTGAGIKCDGTSPTITNCVIEYNEGDGIYCSGDSSPTVVSCLIQNNNSHGIYCLGDDDYHPLPTIKNNKIRYNNGSGIYCNKTNQVIMKNNWMCDNQESGIILFSSAEAAMVHNNTVAGNEYGIWYATGYGARPIISNCIVWGNNLNLYNTGSNVSYCCVEGGYSSGQEIIDDAPLFVDPTSGDYHLMSGSPCITNPGDSTGILDGETDIDGEQRVIGAGVDRGADEFPRFMVEAGRNREVALLTIPREVKLVDADITWNDSGEPPSYSIEWSQLSGPDPGVEFVDDSVEKATAQFTEIGTYVLKLEVEEQGGEQQQLGWDTVTIVVNMGIEAVSVPEELIWPDNMVQLHGVFTGGSPVEIEWFGPPGVTFDPSGPVTPADVVVNATFPELDVYPLWLVARDGGGGVIGWDTIWVPVKSQQLEVNAGTYPEITLSAGGTATLDLTGTVTGGVPYRTYWTSSEGVEFVDASELYTTATFTRPDTYPLGLTAKSRWGMVIGCDVTWVTVNPAPVEVDAGSYEPITLPDTLQLNGSIVSGYPDRTEWSGPSGVTFDPVDALDAEVTFPGANIYELVLTAYDNDMVAGEDRTWVTVNPQIIEATVSTGDYGPFVFEPAKPIPLDNAEVISGDPHSFLWIGPDTPYLQIHNPGSLTGAAVQFFATGEFPLALVARNADGHMIGYDEVTIVVDQLEINASVDAVSDIDEGQITFPQAVDLYGSITNLDHVPDGVTMEWDGPAEFDYTSGWEHVTAEFAEPGGAYYLNLLAKYGGEIIAADTVIITVNQAPGIVNAGEDQETQISDPAVPVQLNGSIRGTPPPNVLYHWYLFSYTGPYTNWKQFLPQSYGGTSYTDQNPQVTFQIHGTWEFLLEAFDGVRDDYDYYIGSDTVKVTVNPANQQPTVRAGYIERGVVSIGIPFNNAQVWDEDPVEMLDLLWSMVSGPPGVVEEDLIFEPPTKDALNPTVTFPVIGPYELKLTATDIDGVSGEGTVAVKVGDDSQETAIGAGGDRNTTKCTEHLDEAWVVPILTGDVSWTALSVPTGGYVAFIDPAKEPTDPANHHSTISQVLRPLVTFSASGSCEDEVSGDYVLELKLTGQGPQDLTSQVTITVSDTDTTAPVITAFYGTIDAVSIEDGENLEGRINLVAVAEDESLDELKLELDYDVIEQEKVNIEILKGVPGDAQKLRLTYSIHTNRLSAGGHTFTAIATDKVGHESSRSIGFGVRDAAADGPAAAAITGWQDEAALQDVPPVVHGFNQEPDPLTTIVDKGLIRLRGAAYHPNPSVETVEYRIQLFKAPIGEFDEDHTQYSYWNGAMYNAYFVKNITPDITQDELLNNDGFHELGSQIQDGGSLGDLDLTGVENGAYQILLTVRRGGGGLPDYANVGFILDCPLKIGNVKFTQEDMVIPVGGVPLRIIRTYDSLNKDIDGDFGHGWTYTLADLDIVLNEGRWEEAPLWGGGTMDLRNSSNFDRDVTLTLPNGQRTTFRFYLDILGRACYEAPAGVTAKLEVSPEQYFLNNVNLWSGQEADEAPVGGAVWLCSAYYDFPAFILTTDDGTKYYIQRRKPYDGEIFDVWDEQQIRLLWAEPCGKPYLSRIITASGEEINFNVNGSTLRIGNIEYKDADGVLTKAIKVEYKDGRISKIRAPSEEDEQAKPPTLKYEYDGYGNLKKVSKLVFADDPENPGNPRYEETEYIYDDDDMYHPWDHYITEIKDPRGLSPIKYHYDNSGRLIGVWDARDNYINIEHSISGKIETVTDRNDNVTIYEYNDRGNVLSVTNSLSQITLYEYTDAHYPDGATKVKVPLVESPGSDDDYSITETDYDSSGRPLRVTDPEGNITDYDYDLHGNLLTTIQRLPDETEVSTMENVYDSVDRLIFTGVRKGELGSYEWYSMTLNYYDGKNRLTDTVQVMLDQYHVQSKEDVFDGNPDAKQLESIGQLPGYQDYSITTYGYDDSAGNPSPDKPYSITDPAGFTRYFEYDKNGNQIKTWYEWDDPSNGTGVDKTVYTFTFYDAQGRVILTARQVDNPTYNPATATVLSQTWYNSIGKVEATEGEHLPGELGVLTEYDYDELGNLVETRVYDPSDTLLTITQNLYDNEGRVIVTIGPYAAGDEPVGTETVYDALGRVVKTRRWANVAIDLEDLVDGNGEVVGRKVKDGFIIGNAGDDSPLAWKSGGSDPVIGSELSYTRTIYDVAGRVKHSVTLEEVWDDGTNDYEIKEQPTTYEYDDAGKQTTVIDPLGHDISYTYDAGRDIYWIDFDTPGSATLNGTHTTETQYDGTRRSSVTDAEGRTTSFVYDALNRVITTQYPDTAAHGTTYSHVGYDGLGRKAWQTEPTDNIGTLDDTDGLRWFEYDTSGRLTATILSKVDISGTWYRPRYEYKYDSYGNLEEIWDNITELAVEPYTIDSSNKRVTKFTYNELNQKTSREMPDGSKEYWDYDDFGRVKVHIDFKEQATGYFYNSRGFLEYKRYYVADGTIDGINDNYETYPESPDEETQYVYDELGRKETITDSRGTTTYVYDAEGKIESVITPEGTVNYTYDSVTSRKTNTNTASGNTNTNYSYDQLGRLKEVITADETATYEYDAVGNRDWIELDLDVTAGYEIKTDYTYDNCNRLTDLVQQKTGGASLSTYNYTLKADGMRSSLDETIERTGGSSETHNITYGYDNLNRLTSETADSSGDGYTATYKYNLVGNRAEGTSPKGRTITTNNGTLGTEYIYYTDGSDRLHKEIHSGPVYVAYLHENDRYYAYAGLNGGYYYRDTLGHTIGSLQAFIMGLPSVWSRYVFVLAMVLVPVLLFGPGALRLANRYVLRRPVSMRLRVPRKGICLLVAFVMLLGPESFHNLSQADVQYANLSTATWANGDTTITYTYDDNGSVETKTTTVTSTSAVVETVSNVYNLAGRLAEITTTIDDTVEVVQYTYNDAGIRVKSEFTCTVSGVTDQTRTTTYLIDSYNHTGYAQPLEEETVTTDYIGGVPQTPVTETTTYLIGDDVIAQNDGTTQYLLYDGHGSTRQLAEYDGVSGEVTIVDGFSYDGYGVLLQDESIAQYDPGYTPQQATNLLYAGEHFDTDAQQYYLRARYYDPLNGRFNRMDPFAGNNRDPQSLHKYLYVHCNPINGIDPSGLNYTYAGQLTVSVVIGEMIAVSLPYLGTGLLVLTTATLLAMLYELSHEYLAAGATSAAEAIRSNAREAMNALRKAAKTLKKTIKDLLKQKPFFVWERAMPNIYRFTLSCLVTNPMWYSLTWHGKPSWTARNRAWVLSRYGYLRTPSHNSIDEFPYASTLEGGFPSARGCAVPLIENCIQGGYLRAHYYGILRKPMTKFLVVPVPKFNKF